MSCRGMWWLFLIVWSHRKWAVTPASAQSPSSSNLGRMLCICWPFQTQLFIVAFQIPGRSKEKTKELQDLKEGGRTEE